MKTINKKTNSKAETLRNSILNSTKNYKDAIYGLIESNSEHLKTALNSNKDLVDTIQEQFKSREVDLSHITKVKKALGKSVEMAEETIDAVIDAYNKQVYTSIEFNSKLIQMIKDLDVDRSQQSEKLFDFVEENLECSIKLSTDGIKDILEAYNRNTNFALNFNKTFGPILNSQIEAVQKVRNNNIDVLKHWIPELTKNNGEEARI